MEWVRLGVFLTLRPLGVAKAVVDKDPVAKLVSPGAPDMDSEGRRSNAPVPISRAISPPLSGREILAARASMEQEADDASLARRLSWRPSKRAATCAGPSSSPSSCQCAAGLLVPLPLTSLLKCWSLILREATGSC